MKSLPSIVVTLAFLLLLAVLLAKGQVKEPARPSSANAFNESETKKIPPEYDADYYPIMKVENVRLREMIEYQRSIIVPALNELLQHPVKCEAVVDDPDTFAAYQELMSKRKRFRLTDYCIEKGCDARRNLYSCLSVDLEKKIQADLTGEICTDYPNPGTIRAFLEVWKENPCSEAAAIAVIKVKSPLYSALYYRDDDGNIITSNPYLEELNEIDDYLTANYPNTWQAQSAVCAKTIMNNAMGSDAAIAAQEAWIKRVEDGKLLTDKYFVASFSSNPRDFVTGEYGRLADMYNKRLRVQSNQATETKSDDELQKCLKYYDLLVNVQDGYGREKGLLKEFQLVHGNQYCVDLVRKNAPEHAKERPLRDQNKETGQ